MPVVESEEGGGTAGGAGRFVRSRQGGGGGSVLHMLMKSNMRVCDGFTKRDSLLSMKSMKIRLENRECLLVLVRFFIHSETGSRIFAGCQLLTSRCGDKKQFSRLEILTLERIASY